MKREIKIGITVMIGIVLLYLVIAWIKQVHLFEDGRRTYQIKFLNVSGLLQGTAVNVFGVPSGQVTAIRPMQQFVLVDIKLSDKIILYKDARAELQLKDLTGSKIIELKPGQNGVVLASGGTIEGITSPDFGEAFSIFGGLINKIETDRINLMLANMEKITLSLIDFAEKTENIQIQPITQELQNTSTALRATMINTNTLIEELKRRNIWEKMDTGFSHVTVMMDKGDKTLMETREMMKEINLLAQKTQKSTLPRTDTLLTQLLKVINDTEETIETVDEMVKKLKSDQTVAGRLLNDPTFVRQIDSTLNNLNQTLDFVRQKKIKVSMGVK